MAFIGPVFFIPTASVGVQTTFGRYTGTLRPGLNFKIPFVQQVYQMPTNIRQENFHFRVKTKDDAFTTMHLSVQYKVHEEDAEKAFFSMTNPIQQIDAYIENVIRSHVPKMDLKTLFEDPDSLCKRVKETLGPMMRDNGYTIMNTLVTNIEPDKEIQSAMNRVVASERLRQAATNEAEAEYIKAVRQAEADRDRKRLQGEGIAEQRRAILDGYRDSLAQMRDTLGISAKEALTLTSKTMYYDTLERIGTNKGTRTLFLTHPFAEDGGHGKSTGSNVRQGMLEAMEAQRDEGVKIEPVD